MNKIIISTIMLFCLAILLSTALLAKNNYRPGIYSLSRRQDSSQALGIAGVPAYVISSNRTCRGLFITKATAGGKWQQMGLAPGDVLLSINNRVVSSGEQLDQILASVKGTTSISFARNRGGVPVITNNQVEYGSSTTFHFQTAEMPKSKNNPVSEESISSLESHMVEIINQDRSHNGSVPSVHANSALSGLARNYAQYMLDNNYFGHNTPDGRSPRDRARQAGLNCSVAENISMGSRNSGDRAMLEFCQKQMMSEPPNQPNHRGNILDPNHSCVGVGIARNNSKIIMVQEFSPSCP